MEPQRVRHNWATEPHTPILGAYLLMSITASSLTDPFVVTQCPSLSFFMSSVLESVWSDVNFVSPDFLSFLFYTQPLWTVIYLSPYCLLGERWSLIRQRALQHNKVSDTARGPLARAGCPSVPRSPQCLPHSSLVDVVMGTWWIFIFSQHLLLLGRKLW